MQQSHHALQLEKERRKERERKKERKRANRKWSLNIAAITAIAVRAVSLWGESLVDGVKVGVGGHGISARRHPLVNSV